MPFDKEYSADLYFRLSEQDGDKAESNSISNQRELVMDYLKSHPEIKVHAERIDDGRSGVDFNRPGFQQMMTDIRAGDVNCVIVKDLSRFGRNFIESGKYIQQIFPFLGVRFIAINDGYDSLHSNPSTDSLLVPVKNLMNDSYSRDTSVKIRSHLDVKKRNGEFVSAFAVFGYQKSKDDRHKLVIDEFAAGVVRDIFKWKLEGFSQAAIAERLNTQGIPSPLEYKKQCGMNYKSGLQVKPRTEWTATTVGRILCNAVYTGRLEQGKRVRPNYKVKKSMLRNRDEWICTENAHEPIVSEEDFSIVNALLSVDSRVSPAAEKVYLLSGLVFCGDCKQGMSHRTVTAGGKKYAYYVCSSNKLNKNDCTLHNISEPGLIAVVEEAIRSHMAAVLHIERLLEYIASLPAHASEAQKIDKQLEKLNADLERNMKYKLAAFEKRLEGKISESMYREYTEIYEKKCADIRTAIDNRKKALNDVLNNHAPRSAWIEHFRKYRNMEHLDRLMAVKLIDRIYVYEGNRIEVQFRYQSQFDSSLAYIEAAQSCTGLQPETVLKGVG